MIKPEDLEERDTIEVLSLYGRNKKEIQKQKWRDLLKHAIIKATKTTVFVLLGIENQGEIHYAMPVKNMIYDGESYGMQIRAAAARHKEDKDYGSGAEFLSGFHKEDKLTPVVTLTVYWGADEWDAPRSLHEMLVVSDSEVLRNWHRIAAKAESIEAFEQAAGLLGGHRVAQHGDTSGAVRQGDVAP